MISFKEYLAEKALHVYDIDDTILRTNAQIHVKDHTGKTVKKLSNQEFNDHKLEKGHHYDFSEFKDSEKFNKESKPMHGMLQQLKRVHQKAKLGLNKGSKIVFNTARSDFDSKDTFLDTFKKHGVDIDDIHVHRAGNIPGNDSPAQKKLHYFRKHLDTGNYSECHFHDDSKTNLRAFHGLRKEYPHIKFHAWHVNHEGNIRPFGEKE
jgi:hypothetical protein